MDETNGGGDVFTDDSRDSETDESHAGATDDTAVGDGATDETPTGEPTASTAGDGATDETPTGEVTASTAGDETDANPTTERGERVSSGIEGLDRILNGGYFAERNYTLTGGPGSGKTLFALTFLADGAAAGETVLFVNLEEDVADLQRNAANVGIDTTDIEFLDLSPNAEEFSEDRSYSVFEAADVEGDPLTERISEAIVELEPSRVVIDPISQFRYLTSDDYQFRKQIVGLSRFLKRYGATVLFTSKSTPDDPSDDIQFLADGTVALRSTTGGRRLAVPKFRGSGTQSGDHAVRITDDGVRVFPELAPGVHAAAEIEPIPSGLPEVDKLLNGGLERGTISVIAGPTGVGKTTLGTQFMKEAAGRGERSVVYLFEENRQTFITRSEAVNIPVERMIEQGTLYLEEVEALDMSPQEFAGRVRDQVENDGAEIVMIDGLAGYEITLSGDESDVRRRLHALGRYLKNNGVTAIFIDEVSEVTGPFQATNDNISYLTDNIVFLRHLELNGELRKAIGVLKKRTSDFERTLREFKITAHGITVGEPLTQLRDVLSGTPRRVDEK